MRSVSGGSGHGRIREGQSILNDTQSEYEVHYGYSTVANGHASRVAVQPGEVARLDSRGDAYSFFSWSIGCEDEFPASLYKRKVSEF